MICTVALMISLFFISGWKGTHWLEIPRDLWDSVMSNGGNTVLLDYAPLEYKVAGLVASWFSRVHVFFRVTFAKSFSF